MKSPAGGTPSPAIAVRCSWRRWALKGVSSMLSTSRVSSPGGAYPSYFVPFFCDQILKASNPAALPFVARKNAIPKRFHSCQSVAAVFGMRLPQSGHSPSS